MILRLICIAGVLAFITVSLCSGQEKPVQEKVKDIEYERIPIPLEKEKYLTLQGFLKGLLREFDLEMPEGVGKTDKKIDLSGIKGFVAVKTISVTLGPKLNADIDRGILVLTYKREDALELKTAIQKSLVRVLLRLFQTSDNPLTIQENKYGIRIANEHKEGRISVLLVHGIDSDPSSFRNIIDAFSEKWNMYVFRYPNDQAIAKSAVLLSKELANIPDASLNILAFSMGALVVREYICTPSLYNKKVIKFLMAAPPNNGSQLAGLRHVLEYGEAFKIISAEDKKWKDALLELTADGLGRAGDDLKPGSLFLDRLSQKKFPKGVTYGVIAGDLALITKAQHAKLVKWLKDKKESISNAALQIAFLKVVGDIEKTREVIHGNGDMVVSLESARLKGAVFFKVFHRNHINLLKDMGESPVLKLIDSFFSKKSEK